MVKLIHELIRSLNEDSRNRDINDWDKELSEIGSLIMVKKQTKNLTLINEQEIKI